MRQTIRLILDDALDGPTNMGRDLALLERVDRGVSAATLRWYRWAPPTISLGYFQRYADYSALPPPAGDLAVVRRVTGGGAILHDAEWTYALVLPVPHVMVGHHPSCLYQSMHAAIAHAAGAIGRPARIRGACGAPASARADAFFCFGREHPTDVVLGTAKLAGSAQRRRRHAILQHGSIILDRRYPQQPCADLGAPAMPQAMVDAVVRALSYDWQTQFEPGEWNEDELHDSEAQARMFRDPAFTQRR